MIHRCMLAIAIGTLIINQAIVIQAQTPTSESAQGWNALTQSEQAGIITVLSVVVLSAVVLAVGKTIWKNVQEDRAWNALANGGNISAAAQQLTDVLNAQAKQYTGENSDQMNLKKLSDLAAVTKKFIGVNPANPRSWSAAQAGLKQFLQNFDSPARIKQWVLDLLDQFQSKLSGDSLSWVQGQINQIAQSVIDEKFTAESTDQTLRELKSKIQQVSIDNALSNGEFIEELKIAAHNLSVRTQEESALQFLKTNLADLQAGSNIDAIARNLAGNRSAWELVSNALTSAQANKPEIDSAEITTQRNAILSSVPTREQDARSALFQATIAAIKADAAQPSTAKNLDILQEIVTAMKAQSSTPEAFIAVAQKVITLIQSNNQLPEGDEAIAEFIQSHAPEHTPAVHEQRRVQWADPLEQVKEYYPEKGMEE